MPIHQLSELHERNPLPKPWIDVKANLPWGEIEFSKKMLKEQQLLQEGDVVVFVGVMPLHEQGRANMIKVSRI